MAKKQKNIKKYEMKKLKIDPVFRSYFYNKYINKLMFSGKKSILENIVMRSMSLLKIHIDRKSVSVFITALSRIKPVIGMIKKRLGRHQKDVPTAIKTKKQVVLGLNWLVMHTKVDKYRQLYNKIANTFYEIFNNKLKWNFSSRKYQQFISQLVRHRLNVRYRWQ